MKIKTTVLRIKNIASILGAMLEEGELNTGVEFALKVDQALGEIGHPITAIEKSERRLVEKYADLGTDKKPKRTEKGGYKITDPEKVDALQDEMNSLLVSEMEIEITPRFTVGEFESNGIKLSVGRKANLSSLLSDYPKEN